MDEKYWAEQAKVTGDWHVYTQDDDGAKYDIATCRQEGRARDIVAALHAAWEQSLRE